MTRDELVQYQDLQKEIKALENRIAEVKESRKNIVSDTVTASNTEFPYQQMSLNIEGVADSSGKLNRLYLILNKRKRKCEELKLEIEEFIGNIPISRTRRVFEMRYINGWSWQKIAFNIGKYNESYPRKDIHDKYLNEIRPKRPNQKC